MNVIGTVYYTLLLYGFSWFGILVTSTLTIVPFFGGIYLRHVVGKAFAGSKIYFVD
jgi:hypothetical protein